jgi:hypothetical protein
MYHNARKKLSFFLKFVFDNPLIFCKAPAPTDPLVTTCTPDPVLKAPINCYEPNTGELPPVDITVDYGDSSGPNFWTRTNKIVLWSHVYTRPGKYDLTVQSKRCSLLLRNLNLPKMTEFD